MPDWFKPEEVLTSALLAGFVLIGIKLLPRLLAGVPFVTPLALKEHIDSGKDLLVLDVRNANEFTDELGHVPGALNVPLSTLSSRIDSIRPQLEAYKHTPLYVICRTSNRAASAANLLKKAGMADIKVVAGGMARWKREGLPISREV